MKQKSIIILLVITGIILISIYGIIKGINFLKVDSCLDSGGRWNYTLNKCEYIDLESELLNTYYWYSEYDSINNTEILVKGRLVDSIYKNVHGLINILNKRETKCTLEFIDQSKDTVKIKVINDEYLTEQMGTTGALFYIAETVFTLTEDQTINYISLEMNYGSHASPGTYNRNDFKALLYKPD